MDAGAAKVRRKLTKPVDLISAVYLFTDAERDIFKAFVEDAIQGGSLPFQYQLCGGDYMLVRLVPSDENTLYTIQRESNRWSITVTLEVV
jgi:hypothetical protein